MFLAMEFELVTAAGIDARKLSPEVVYELAGKIIRATASSCGTRVDVLRAMTEKERDDLRIRIGATPADLTAKKVR